MNRLTWEWFFLLAMGGALGVTYLITGRWPWELAMGGLASHSTRKVIAVEEDKQTVSRVFARSPYFKIVDDSRVVEVVRNPYVDAVPAGPPAAQLVASYGPSVVVTRAIGRLARKELQDRGIKIEIQ